MTSLSRTPPLSKSPPPFKDVVIGIDFGSSNSCLGVWKDGHVEIIPSLLGNRIIPSIVSFPTLRQNSPQLERLVGEAAEFQALNNPETTIYNFKELLGGEIAETWRSFKLYPSSSLDRPCIKVSLGEGEGEEEFCPEEITAMFLLHLKETAEAYLGSKVDRVIISVPGSYNDAQRQAIMDAANIAGLPVVRLLNDTTATALFFRNQQRTREKILVCDFGAATSDVALVDLNNRGLEVLARAGEKLGGNDFTQRLVKHLLFSMDEENLTENASLSLWTACEKAKKILSVYPQTEVRVESGLIGASLVSREQFESISEDLLVKCANLVEKVLEEAKISKIQVDQVILVGGCSRIPRLRQLITDFFNGKKPASFVNPDESVALGSTLAAVSMDSLVIDLLPHSITIEYSESLGEGVLFKQNSKLPLKEERVFWVGSSGLLLRLYEQALAESPPRLLGTFTVDGSSGVGEEEEEEEEVKSRIIRFNLDVSGILSVELVTGTGVTMEGELKEERRQLTMEQLIRMKKKLAGRKEKEEEDSRRAVEQLCFNIHQYLMTGGDLSISNKSALQSILITSLQWLISHPDAEKEEYDEFGRALQDDFSAFLSSP